MPPNRHLASSRKQRTLGFVIATYGAELQLFLLVGGGKGLWREKGAEEEKEPQEGAGGSGEEEKTVGNSPNPKGSPVRSAARVGPRWAYRKNRVSYGDPIFLE
jgi:hypothetical protein